MTERDDRGRGEDEEAWGEEADRGPSEVTKKKRPISICAEMWEIHVLKGGRQHEALAGASSVKEYRRIN